ncbi:MAG: hypothetical protein IPJ74_16280 [Saprospiraceae bacterium]|nr:hypothetical protein [Saprospiraceae bacterium]
MMNTRTVISAILLILSLFGLSAQSIDLTTEEWKEDITFLKKKLDITFSVMPKQRQQVEQALATLQNKLSEMNDIAIIAEMGRIVTLVGDGHTELNLTQWTTGFHKIPMIFSFFGKDLHILATSPDYQNTLSKKVMRFDNTPTTEVYEKLQPFMSHDNDQEFKYAAPAYFTVIALLHHIGISQHPDRVTLELEDGSTVEVKALSAEESRKINWARARDINAPQQPLSVQNPTDYYWYKFLEDSNTFYFKFNRVGDQKDKPSIRKFVKEMFDEIDKLKPSKLVIDLRHNNGGNYYMNRPLVEAIQERPWLNQKGKLFVINGPRTFSAAAVTTIF